MCPRKYCGVAVESPDHGRTYHPVPGEPHGVETPDDAFKFIHHVLLHRPENLTFEEQEHYRWYTSQGALFDYWFEEYSKQKLKFEDLHRMQYDVRRTALETRRVSQETRQVTQQTQDLAEYLQQSLNREARLQHQVEEAKRQGTTPENWTMRLTELCQCGECRRTAKAGKGKSPSVAKC